ncbi:hypothetical protein Daesc_008741 [Daldinia eschscholtzii]|uniref:F-box domain-containing protein n=1 Tax=Daldinia eschscholtzii TaxID=292717 RepID=A0AAX6MD72_9PEZI
MADDNTPTKPEQALSLVRSKATNTNNSSNSSSNKSCLLLGQPLELVSHTLSFLDPSQVALFSLTCKDASHLVRGTNYGKTCLASIDSALHTNSNQASSERSEFLHHLTKDLPHQFSCKRCSKLHQNLVNLTEEGPNALQNSISIHRQKDLMTFGPLWPQYAFARKQCRQAILDTMGNSNDSELSLATPLAISTDWKLRRLGTSCNNPEFIHGYVKLDTEAIVINSRLHFHKTQRILLLPDRLKPFLSANSSSPMEQVFQSCCHGTEFRSTFRPSLDMLDWKGLRGMSVLDTITKFTNMARAGLLLVTPSTSDGYDPGKHPPHKYKPLPYPHAGCKHCMTEDITTIHNHGRGGVEIVIDVFQNLGNCTSNILPNRLNLDKHKNNEWGYCWSGLSYEYRSLKSRREEYSLIHPGIFPTRPGESARDHPSAPSIQDIWELHDRQREARSKLVVKISGTV